MANYGVILRIDPPASAAIESLFQQMATSGINASMVSEAVYPHITLAIYEEHYPAGLDALLPEFAHQISPLNLTLSSIGLFPGDEGTLFLAPTPSDRLTRASRLYHDITRDFRAACSPYYHPENWVPHCTLAHPIAADSAAKVINEIPALSSEWKPIPVTCSTVEFVEFYPIKRLQTLRLAAS